MRHVFRYRWDGVASAGARVALTSTDAHHLTHVVRRGPGAAVEVIDGAGDVWPAVVVSNAPEAVVEFGEAPVRRVAPAPLTLYVGLCEWGRLDTAVEKCTELGVARIVVFAGARSQRVPDADAWARRRERLVRVADAASRQSGQPRVPEIDGLLSFAEVCAGVAGAPALVLDPRGTRPFGDLARAGRGGALAVVVGPDTGLAADELAAAMTAGATVCHIGRTTLRAETAVIVAASIALEAIGYLDDEPTVPTHDPEDD